MNKELLMEAHRTVHCPIRFARALEKLESFIRADSYDEYLRILESYTKRSASGGAKEALSQLEAPIRWEVFMKVAALDFNPGVGKACRELV